MPLVKVAIRSFWRSLTRSKIPRFHVNIPNSMARFYSRFNAVFTVVDNGATHGMFSMNVKIDTMKVLTPSDKWRFLSVFIAVVVVAGCASPRTSRSAQGPKTKSTTQPLAMNENKKVIITGSYIPRTVRTNGEVTDVGWPVSVFNREDIERSGASSVAELLRNRVPTAR